MCLSKYEYKATKHKLSNLSQNNLVPYEEIFQFV